MVCCRIGLGPSWGILRWVPRGIGDRAGPKRRHFPILLLRALGSWGREGEMSSIPHPHCWNKIMGGLLRDPQTCVLLADPCSVILGPFEL